MKNSKSTYFRTCEIPIKLLPLVILCFLLGCSRQKEAKQVLLTENKFIISASAINVNTASPEELEKLPHIGAKLARKIVEHREELGKFRKAEYLILLDGISDARFREIRSLVKVE